MRIIGKIAQILVFTLIYCFSVAFSYTGKQAQIGAQGICNHQQTSAYFFIADNLQFHVILTEPAASATCISQLRHFTPTNDSLSACILYQKTVHFILSPRYVSHSRIVCAILHKSDLLYPFHTFG